MAKLTKTTVGKRYARALFELTHPDHDDDATLAELTTIAGVLSANPQLLQALTAVNISDSAKKEMLTTLTTDASTLVQHLVDMVYENRRIADLPMIIKQYKLLVDRANKVVTANVTTAIDLDDVQSKRLSDKLMTLFDANEVILVKHVNPDILGGVKVEANNRVLDGTLSTKLANIHQSITN